MWKMRLCVFVTATLALTIFLSLGSLEVFADQTIKVPPNAKVEIRGASAIISGGGGGGAGEIGNWSCNCSKSGTCTITRLEDGIKCGKGAGTCNGACELVTSTTGVAPGMMAPPSKSNSSKPSAQSPSTAK